MKLSGSIVFHGKANKRKKLTLEQLQSAKTGVYTCDPDGIGNKHTHLFIVFAPLYGGLTTRTILYCSNADCCNLSPMNPQAWEGSTFYPVSADFLITGLAEGKK